MAIGIPAIVGNFAWLIMIGKVNERVPEPERISYFWGSASLVHRYRQLYPNGRMALVYRVCLIVMVVDFILLLYFIG